MSIPAQLSVFLSVILSLFVIVSLYVCVTDLGFGQVFTKACFCVHPFSPTTSLGQKGTWARTGLDKNRPRQKQVVTTGLVWWQVCRSLWVTFSRSQPPSTTPLKKVHFLLASVESMRSGAIPLEKNDALPVSCVKPSAQPRWDESIICFGLWTHFEGSRPEWCISTLYRGFPTRMVYLEHDVVEIHHSGWKPLISCLRYTILVGKPQFICVLFQEEWVKECEQERVSVNVCVCVSVRVWVSRQKERGLDRFGQRQFCMFEKKGHCFPWHY